MVNAELQEKTAVAEASQITAEEESWCTIALNAVPADQREQFAAVPQDVSMCFSRTLCYPHPHMWLLCVCVCVCVFVSVTKGRKKRQRENRPTCCKLLLLLIIALWAQT